jgi:hypothetical protein
MAPTLEPNGVTHEVEEAGARMVADESSESLAPWLDRVRYQNSVFLQCTTVEFRWTSLSLFSHDSIVTTH